MITVSVDQKTPPVGVLLVLEHLKKFNVPLDVKAGVGTFVVVRDNKISGETAVARYLGRKYLCAKLYGESVLQSSQIDGWLDFSNIYLRSSQDVELAMMEINKRLAPSSYLVGHDSSLADFAVWGALSKLDKLEIILNGEWAGSNIERWLRHCSKQDVFKAVQSGIRKPSNLKQKDNASQGNKLQAQMEEGGKFVALPGAKKGEVVVRFPPEASGYLHIGHAKAALLNQYYKDLHDGKLIMRFDDTNPAKENSHFEEIILEDVKLLQLTPDMYTRTSDHFESLLSYAEQLIRQGDAYCDDTSLEEMRRMREERIPSPKRNTSPDINLLLFEEMRKGTDVGLANCLRAKIDYKSDNGCLRDPVLYRCRNEEHLVTGNKYVVYPTYDFACPIVDSNEGVTHALRTTEYQDRDQQYYWIIEKLGLRKPHICSYSRLALVNTVLSKRKLTYLVDEGYVEGWNDARMPTVRGVLRRGLTISGLKEFIIAQGFSKSNVHMEWDKIWSFNKKIIDPTAPRYNALLKENAVPVTISDATEGTAQYQKHPKNPDLGMKPVFYSNKVFVEGEDAKLMKVDTLVTFINWGNVRITKINRSGDAVVSIEAKLELENQNFKNTMKITWLAQHSATPLIPTKCIFFENIIEKADMTREDNFKDHINKNSKFELDMFGDPCLADLKKGDIIQLQRRGYFICDQPYTVASRHSGRESPCVLYHIPDGSTTGMMNQGKEKKENTQSANTQDDKSGKKQRTEASFDGKKQRGSNQSNQKNSSGEVKHTEEEQQVYNEIIALGDKIRNLKSEGSSKDKVQAAVKDLLALKDHFKAVTGKDYIAPGSSKTAKSTNSKKIVQQESTRGISTSAAASSSSESDTLKQKIIEQGKRIRSMKADKVAKDLLQPEIDMLLKMKADFKVVTGTDYQAPGGNKRNEKKKENKSAAQEKEGKVVQKEQKPEKKNDKVDNMVKKQTRLGLEAKKEECLSDWYQQVITKAEMIEYYDVSGCYILRPWSFGIWEKVQQYFDAKIKALGVEGCYFPMFVSQSALEKEKDHIADFAPEVAWVTKSGESELAEPIAVRPTSETVMYPAYAKWIQSYRDLPLRLNQWCNVVRWEFKHPQPFLRTREFLWQEGHSAFAGKEEAIDEVYEIVDLYREVYEHLLAIPVVKGRKTEKEKFAGGDFTTTVEAYIHASGRAIQGATSHHLGQNFSKMFGIMVEDPTKPDSNEKLYVYQNSWGITTRTIGVVVMVHGDNKGLVLPPRAANVQVVIVPVGLSATAEEIENIVKTCLHYEKMLKDAKLRVTFDNRDNYSPGWKFNHWELKGVPLRIEVGPREIKKNEFVVVRRDTGFKQTLKKDEKCVKEIQDLLESIQNDMYSRAKQQLSDNMTVTTSWKEFNDMLEKGKIMQAPFCGEISCEEKIKKDSASEESTDAGAPSMGAKTLCIPCDQPAPIVSEKCIHPDCGRAALFYTLFGRSY